MNDQRVTAAAPEDHVAEPVASPGPRSRWGGRMTRDEIIAADAALPDLPAPQAEPSWCQLLDTFDAFAANGQDIAEYFRMMIREFGERDVDRAFRQSAPELFDLMLRAFPPSS